MNNYHLLLRSVHDLTRLNGLTTLFNICSNAIWYSLRGRILRPPTITYLLRLLFAGPHFADIWCPPKWRDQSESSQNTAIKGEGVWNCSMKFMTNPNHIILTGSRWGHGSGVQEEHQSSCCWQPCQYQRCHLLALRSLHSQGELLCHDQIGPQPCNFSGNTWWKVSQNLNLNIHF